MYGDDEGGWAFPSPVDHTNFSLDADPKYSQSFLRSSQQTIEDSAYYDSTYDPPNLNIHSSPMDVKKITKETTYLTYPDDDRRPNHISDNHVPPRPPSQRQLNSPNPSTLGSLRPPPTPPMGSRASSRNSSQPVSFGSPIEASSSSRSQSRLHSLLVPAVPIIPSPFISPISITPSSFEAPLEGEDLDAFHVRRTYAELEIIGVKGDGYNEGVERTRAKVGASRESELRAMEALGNESEKKRELSAREIEMLASLDRCVVNSYIHKTQLILINLQCECLVMDFSRRLHMTD
jgi:USP6 N-terminal-like protein